MKFHWPLHTLYTPTWSWRFRYIQGVHNVRPKNEAPWRGTPWRSKSGILNTRPDKDVYAACIPLKIIRYNDFYWKEGIFMLFLLKMLLIKPYKRSNSVWSKLWKFALVLSLSVPEIPLPNTAWLELPMTRFWRVQGSISSTWLLEAFTHAYTWVLNLYFTNNYTLNKKLHPTFTLCASKINIVNYCCPNACYSV